MRKLPLSFLAVVLIMSTFLALPTSADTKGTPNSNASGYWNEERRNNAIPREFQFEVGATEGKLTPQARRVSNGGGTNYPSGTTVKWSSADKLEAKLTGKIFFTMAKQDYVCSGSLINDGNTSIDIVVTAAHCVWNNSKNPSQSGFASNWTFYPNYFTTLKTNGVPASLLFAPSEFTKQTTFNTVATLNDFAFAVLPSNIFPDDSKPSVAPASGGFLTSVGNAFGYPQASPYDGQFLYRSYGEISEDANNGKKTWRIPSDMTGGASGGPWYEGYKEGETLGTNVSVNSYKYSGDTKGMYGPKFSQLTIDVLTQAKTNSCPNSSSLISCRKL